MNAPTYGPSGLARLRQLTWWTMVGCLAVVVGLVVAESAVVRPAAIRLAVVATVLLVCVVAGCLFAVAVLGTPPPRPAVTASLVVVAASAAGGILVLSRTVASGGFPWTLPLAALSAAVWAGTRWRRQLIWPAGIGLAFGASSTGSWLAGAMPWSPAVEDTAITALCTVGLYAQIWVLGVAERLDHARRLERAAAIREERLRFAADLHDIQGHSLQVIALKSELAERLANADPARAIAEMRDVQALARQALGDTREVVRGYRTVSLDTEISNATRVMAAAGIESSLAADPSVLPSPVEKLFGLVVRECTTNVLRHSAARRCEISLTIGADIVQLRFTNDAPLDAPAGPGGGLTGLADRFAAAGGRLVAEGTADTFTVCAYLPTQVIR